MVGCCEHGNKPSGPIKCGKYVNTSKMRNVWLLKKNLLREFISICAIRIL
jgi:hypothetical protein